MIRNTACELPWNDLHFLQNTTVRGKIKDTQNCYSARMNTWPRHEVLLHIFCGNTEECKQSSSSKAKWWTALILMVEAAVSYLTSGIHESGWTQQ